MLPSINLWKGKGLRKEVLLLGVKPWVYGLKCQCSATEPQLLVAVMAQC